MSAQNFLLCIFPRLHEGDRCSRCGYVLSRDYTGERVIRNCTDPPTHRDLTRSTDCRHRGETIRTKDCKGCRGNVRVKVFECTIHNECSLAKAVGVVVCVRCDDYEAKEG